jgi:hypothetical protein
MKHKLMGIEMSHRDKKSAKGSRAKERRERERERSGTEHIALLAHIERYHKSKVDNPKSV